jgi:hypothetical protein
LVQAELDASRLGQTSATVRNRAEGFVGFGDDYTPGSHAEVLSPAWLAGKDGQSAELNPNSWHLSGRLGARVEQGSDPVLADKVQARLTGSAVVATLGPVNLQASSHNTWWGPGWQSTLVASNNVPAWNALGFQRAESGTSESPWLSWMGPWSFEYLAAQAQDPLVVPPSPALIPTGQESGAQSTGYMYSAQRVTIKPAPWLEMAVSHATQSNGAGHVSNNLQTFLKFSLGMVGKGLHNQANNPGHSIAGYDLRVNCGPLGLRCAGYVQLMGEDNGNRGGLPSEFLGLYGAETWSADGRQRFFLEYADTHCSGVPFEPAMPNCGMVSPRFSQGETNGGRWQGSSFGPDSLMATLGWYDADNRRLVKLSRGEVGNQVGSYNPRYSAYPTPGYSATVLAPHGAAWGVSAKQSFDWLGGTWTPELDYMHLASGVGQGAYRNNDLRVGLTASMPLTGPSWSGPWDSAPFAFFDRASRSLPSQSIWKDIKGSSDRIFSTDVWPGWAWATGGVLLAHTLDNRIDHWAQNHQSSTDKALGRWGSDLPLIYMAGTGIMASGMFGESLNQPASLAFQAGLLAFAGDEVLKFSVGRARPNMNLGDVNYQPGTTKAFNSSFASAHTAIAFAALTPYAQAYDMPWLYGLGVLTGMARIQQRQHWFSDTVAGGAMGYAVATALTYQRERLARYGEAKPGEPTFMVSPNRVDVAWAFQ